MYSVFVGSMCSIDSQTARSSTTHRLRNICHHNAKTLIPGLNEAPQLMPVGAIWEVYIPAALSFGEKGNGQIVPPNSAVIMLVELISIKRNN